MSNSLKILGDIFTEKKKANVLKNETGVFTQKHINQVLNGEIVNPKEHENKPKDNTAINLSINTLLKGQGIDLKDLEGKKVLDIGGGFTELPFLLEGIKTELNIVDPIYSSDINIEINRNRDKIYELIEQFDDHNYKAYKRGDNQDYFYKLNEEFNFILSGLKKWEELNGKDKINLDGAEINILPIVGEEVDLDNNSIDYVFINHTITKIQVDPYKLLQRVYELLKIGGKLYITEAGNIDFSSFGIFNEEFKIGEKYISLAGRNNNTILILEKIK